MNFQTYRKWSAVLSGLFFFAMMGTVYWHINEDGWGATIGAAIAGVIFGVFVYFLSQQASYKTNMLRRYTRIQNGRLMKLVKHNYFVYAILFTIGVLLTATVFVALLAVIVNQRIFLQMNQVLLFAGIISIYYVLDFYPLHQYATSLNKKELIQLEKQEKVGKITLTKYNQYRGWPIFAILILFLALPFLGRHFPKQTLGIGLTAWTVMMAYSIYLIVSSNPETSAIRQRVKNYKKTRTMKWAQNRIGYFIILRLLEWAVIELIALPLIMFSNQSNFTGFWIYYLFWYLLIGSVMVSFYIADFKFTGDLKSKATK